MLPVPRKRTSLRLVFRAGTPAFSCLIAVPWVTCVAFENIPLLGEVVSVEAYSI